MTTLLLDMLYSMRDSARDLCREQVDDRLVDPLYMSQNMRALPSGAINGKALRKFPLRCDVCHRIARTSRITRVVTVESVQKKRATRRSETSSGHRACDGHWSQQR